MMVAASTPHRAAGVLMLVAALLYLMPFVPRGWIPHDEGMLGQSAEYVLRGGIPHVDYEEPYTGGLSWLYAGVFEIAGVDLLNVRRLLLAGAVAASWLIYAISRRYLAPVSAALCTWVALGWSFPNYFAGLPSWWLLICALACIWALMRYAETGRWLYVAAAGLAAGTAIAIKQTGVYLLIALVLTLLYGGGRTGQGPSWASRLDRIARWTAAAAAIVVAAALLWPRVTGTEGVYLFVPAAASGLVLLLPMPQDRAARPTHSATALVLVATVATAVPLLCLLVPYILQDRIWDFVNGSFLLPRKRLTFASAPMRDAWMLTSGIPLVALVLAGPRLGRGSRSAVMKSLLWATAVALPILALRSAAAYQAIWQSARAVAVLIPVVACWRLASGQIRRPEKASMLFGVTAVLAWMSLNQFPFAAPIYFCYVAPLAVIAAMVAADAEASLRRDTFLPWAVMLLLFAVVSANRGYIETLGVHHDPRRFDTPLRLPRAHLRVSASDAREYRRLMFVLGPHLQAGRLVAGPDCPQVYFLAGRTDPSGALFNFFSADASGPRDDDDLSWWQRGDVIVVNRVPHFSPAPSERLLAGLRRTFQFGEQIGAFEVRWR